MKIIRGSVAGTLESSDALVIITPSEGEENSLIVESIVFKQFGARITAVSQETIEASGITGATIKVQDRGALECTLRARLETAVERALSN